MNRIHIHTGGLALVTICGAFCCWSPAWAGSRPATCVPRGDRIVAASSQAVVTTHRTGRFNSYRVYGCLTVSGKRRLLANIRDDLTYVELETVTGKLVAFNTRVDDPSGDSVSRITTVDVQSGRRRSTALIRTGVVQSLVLGRSGQVAWIQRSPTSETTTTNQLVTFDGTKTTTLADDPSLVATSLAIDTSATLIYWTIAGQSFSAPLQTACRSAPSVAGRGDAPRGVACSSWQRSPRQANRQPDSG